jgi:hypothetical protein
VNAVPAIAVRDLAFAYPGEPPVLEEVAFTIAATEPLDFPAAERALAIV